MTKFLIIGVRPCEGPEFKQLAASRMQKSQKKQHKGGDVGASRILAACELLEHAQIIHAASPHPSIHPSVRPSIRPSIHPSIHVFTNYIIATTNISIIPD